MQKMGIFLFITVEQLQVNTVIYLKMYFDNSLKNNHNLYGSNYQNTSLPSFNNFQPSNNQKIISNNKPYSNSSYAQYLQNPKGVGNKNIQQILYQPNINMKFASNPTTNNKIQVQQTLGQNNNTSFHQDLSNNCVIRENNQFFKRRDSISFNNNFNTHQAHSPSNTKNIILQNVGNNTKPYFRTTLGNDNHTRNAVKQQLSQHIMSNNKIEDQNNIGNYGIALQKRIEDNFYHKNKALQERKQQMLNENNLLIDDNKSKSIIDLTEQKCNQKFGYEGNSRYSGQSNSNTESNYSTNSNLSKDYNHQHAINQNSNNFSNKSNNNFSNKVASKHSTPLFSTYKCNTNGLLQQKDPFNKANHKMQPETQFQNKIQSTQSNNPNTNQQYSYNYQLKNITSNLNHHSSSNNQSVYLNYKKSDSPNDFKFFTPHLNKQSQKNQKDFSLNLPVNQINRISDKNNFLEREYNYTQRQINKSPSSNDLFQNIGSKDHRNLKNQISHTNTLQNINQEAINKKKNCPQSKIQFQKFINANDNLQKQKKCSPQSISSTKAYHALIQNLQKKFSQQKKSNESLQMKEKHFSNELSKRDQQIKKLQNIIENNRETIFVKEETIKQLKKKFQISKLDIGSCVKQQLNKQLSITADSGSIKDLEIQELKRQNIKLKDQIKKQRKKSGNNLAFISENTNNLEQKQLKQKINNYENKIRQLQNNFLQIKKQKQSMILQISKLRQANTNLHQEYCTQMNENKKIKEQNYILRKLKEQEEKNLKLMKNKLEEVQKFKIKNQRLQAELNFKNGKIKDLQFKIQQFKKTNDLKAQQKNKLQIQSNSMQIQHLKQKLKKKQEANQLLAEQLKNKTKVFERMLFQKGQLQTKVQKLQNRVKSLKVLDNHQMNSVINDNQQKNDIKLQEKTFSPQSKKDEQSNQQLIELLDLYHQKYQQIASIFNLNEDKKNKNQQEKEVTSLTSMPHQDVDYFQEQVQQQTKKSIPSREYVQSTYPVLKEEIERIHNDLKKLVVVLKQNEDQIQQKNQKLYQLDKTIKKQGVRINGLMGEIHMKNMAIMEINKTQIQKQIQRLNQKYEILGNVNLGLEAQ